MESGIRGGWVVGEAGADPYNQEQVAASRPVAALQDDRTRVHSPAMGLSKETYVGTL